MKVAVSLPNEVFAAAERMIKESGRTRSEVYATAVREYVARHAADQVTAALDRVVAGLPDDESDRRFADVAARHVLTSSEW